MKLGLKTLALWSVGCLCLLTAPLAAEETMVMVKQPAAGEVLFGEVEFSADIFEAEGDPVVSVDFFVDDRFIDRLKSSPWLVRHDVGDRPVPHRFEIVATTRSGEKASAVLVSRGLDVGLEIESALQQLYITVERNDQRVLGLGRESFQVFDNDQPQKIVTFEDGGVPIAALILVDASDSMRGGRLKAALAGAGAFIDGMQPLDQAQVVLFSDRILHQNAVHQLPRGAESRPFRGRGRRRNLPRRSPIHGPGAVGGLSRPTRDHPIVRRYRRIEHPAHARR